MNCCGPSCSGLHPGFTESTTGSISDDGANPSLYRFGTRRTDHSRHHGHSRPLPLPQRCWLSHLLLEGVSFTESVPTTLVWWLTADPKGNVVLTDRKTSTWNASTVAGEPGGIAIRLDQVWVAGLQSDELHLWVYSDDSPDVQIRPRVTWHTLSDLDLSTEHRKLISEG